MDPPPARVPFGNSPLNGRMLVIAVAVLASVILLILGMHLYAKWMWRGVSARQSSLRRRHRQTFLQADASQATTATRGLERAVVEALGTFKYLSAEATDGVLECAVCLSEFEDSEEGRLLPKCKHSFHVDCIDMWLHSNTTCPLCRASVQPDGEGNDAEVPATIVSGSNRSGSVVTHLNQLVANLEDQQLENGVRIVQFPNNVLFWGNQLQLNAQTNSAASRPPVVTDTSASSTAPSHVAIDIPTSQLTIDIPPRPVPAALFLVGPEEASTASPGTTKSQHSGPLSTPSGRLRSLRRLLSRERRPANSNSVEQGPGEIDVEPEGSVHLQRQESQ